MRIARWTSAARRAARESTAMRLVNSGPAHNRRYRLFPAITSDDNVHQPRVTRHMMNTAE